MKRVFAVLVVLANGVWASQVFFMDLAEDVAMSSNIFLARVESAWETPMDYMRRMNYTLSIISVVSCEDSLADSVVAVYTMNLPGVRTDSSGNEVHVSPRVHGSGLELIVDPGDTVLVFGSSMPTGGRTVPMGILRLEHVDSLDSLLTLLEETDHLR